MSDSVAYSWPRSASEEVRAALTTFKGHRLADIRVYWADENDVEYPTRKGICVDVTHLPKRLEAVQTLIEAEHRVA